MSTAKPKSRPIHDIRIGRIQCAIWENSTQNGVLHNVTVSRSYKDGNTWKESSSFSRDDLLVLAKVLDQAHTWIVTRGNEGEKQGN